MRNRKREICTSGSARDEDGQPPHLLGRRNFLHLAAGAADRVAHRYGANLSVAAVRAPRRGDFTMAMFDQMNA